MNCKKKLNKNNKFIFLEVKLHDAFSWLITLRNILSKRNHRIECNSSDAKIVFSKHWKLYQRSNLKEKHLKRNIREAFYRSPFIDVLSFLLILRVYLYTVHSCQSQGQSYNNMFDKPLCPEVQTTFNMPKYWMKKEILHM